MTPEQEKEIKNYCATLSRTDRLDLLACAASVAPGYEGEVYFSIVYKKGYREMFKLGFDLPMRNDDFYAYKRKTIVAFRDLLIATGRLSA